MPGTTALSKRTPRNRPDDSRYVLASSYRRKRIGVPLGSDCSGTNTAYAEAVTRNAIMLPADTVRWRVRGGNAGYKSTTPYAGAISFTGTYIGIPLLDSNGLWAGAFASTPTLAAAAGSSASDGTEYISPWVTDPALQFQAGVLKAVSWGWTCAAGTTIAYSQNRIGRTWFTPGATASVGTAAVPSGSSADSAQLTDFRLEYESVDGLVVVIVISDSTAAGVIDDNNLSFGIPGPHGTWPFQGALRNNFHVINVGVSGSVYGDYDTTRWALKRFDLATSVPDVAVFGCGINEAFSGTAAATWAANAIAIRSQLVALGVKRTMITTVMQQPRFKPGSLLTDVAVGATSMLTTRAYASGDGIDLGALTTNQERVTASAASTANAAGGYTTPVSTTTKTHAAGDTTGLAAETLRVTYNRLGRRGIAGFQSVIDFDAAIKPSDPLFPWWGTASVHPGAGAYALFGSLVKVT